MSKNFLKIAHISDLHFSKIIYTPTQFFSKRWIGNLNVILNRRKIHLNPKPFELVSYLENKDYTHILISGDLSTTSHVKEFHLAKSYIKELEKLGCRVFVIPGNHDCYLKSVEKKKLFYKHFKEYFPQNIDDIKEEKVLKTRLKDDLWLVLLDTTIPCPVHKSQGLYSLKQDLALRKTLASIPKGHKIILMNHFPLFQYESLRRSLLGAGLLQKTLKSFPNVFLYLHGHTHKHAIADLRDSGYPIVLDSGSLSHNHLSFFNSIEVSDDNLNIQSLEYKGKSDWQTFKTLDVSL